LCKMLLREKKRVISIDIVPFTVEDHMDDEEEWKEWNRWIDSKSFIPLQANLSKMSDIQTALKVNMI
jgi:hypothetical protein